MKILNIKAREILDSRGNPTIEAEILAGDFFGKKIKAWSQVPSGESTGDFEAIELRDGDKNRFNGKGVLKAIENIEKIIYPAIKGMYVFDQKKIDKKMIELDGSDNKSNLGANAILAVSMAITRLGAIAKKKKLYQYIAELNNNQNLVIPKPFFNVINGGRHAGNKIAFQEFMISPKENDFEKNYKMAAEFYQKLKKKIENKFDSSATLLGDEGGFAPNNFEKAEEVLDLLMEVASDLKISNKIDFALDVAASEFYDQNQYNLGFKTEKKELKNINEMIEIYKNIVKNYPVISIEDPFDQEDFESFSKLKKELKNIQIVGDDLTVTNIKRIDKAVKNDSANALLLKINQIGTITESIEAFNMAKENGWKVMVSHRSGEVIDDFIADLAVGLGADQIKAGATARGERVAKYNRLLKIKKEIIK